MISERYKTVANMCTMSDSSLDYGNPPQRIFMSCSWSHGNDQWYVDLCDISRYSSLFKSESWLSSTDMIRWSYTTLANIQVWVKSEYLQELTQTWIFARVVNIQVWIKSESRPTSTDILGWSYINLANIQVQFKSDS